MYSIHTYNNVSVTVICMFLLTLSRYWDIKEIGKVCVATNSISVAFIVVAKLHKTSQACFKTVQ